MNLLIKMYGLVTTENFQLPLSYSHACKKHKHFENRMLIMKLPYY